MKKSLFKQMLSMFGAHFLLCLVIVLLMTGVLSIAEKIPAVEGIMILVVVVVYIHTIFSNANECAQKDMKSYSELKPYALKGAVISLGIVVPVILSWIFYAVAWRIAPITEADIPVVTVVANLTYSFFTAPLGSFVDIHGSSANLWGQIASLVIPVAASVAGYYFGFRKWDLTKHIDKVIYEKRK